MSFVSVVPDQFSSATAILTDVGSAVSWANSVAAGPTTTLVAAGADEVSTAVTALSADTPLLTKH